MTKNIISQGLEGVAVSETAIGQVNAAKNYYQYRQYDAVALNQQHSYENVWHLMHFGHLPNDKEAKDFGSHIQSCQLSPSLLKVMRTMAANASDDSLLRNMISLVASISAEEGFKPCLDIDQQEARNNIIRLCGLAPLVLCGFYRLMNKQEPLTPQDGRSFAWNYLYMLEGSEPSEERVWAIERYLISVIDHGFNASTFTSRVIASTGTDVGSAMAGAIGSLSGPLHGGAPSRVLDMLDQIGTPDRVSEWVNNALANKEKIMGFGHRVYKDEDPRSELMKSVAERLGGSRFDLAVLAETEILTVLEKVKSGQKICTNVEYFSSIVMESCRLPRTLFTPSFMVARMIGWGAHILEQISNNRIYRPRSIYNGPDYTRDIPAS